MLRIITLAATLATAGTLAGAAAAHSPGLYDRSYAAMPYGGGCAPAYPSYSASSQGFAPYQPTYSQPVYSQPMQGYATSAPAYTAPAYTAPAYTAPAYDATPLYTKTYRTPYYPAPRQTYGGYGTPGYGYQGVYGY